MNNILQHNFNKTVGTVQKSYINGDVIALDDSIVMNQGVLMNGFYFVKLPKGITTSSALAKYSGGTVYTDYSNKDYDIIYWHIGNIDSRLTKSQIRFNNIEFPVSLDVAAGDYTIEVGFGLLDADQTISQYIPASNLTSAGIADEQKLMSAELKDIIGSDSTYYYTQSFNISVANSNGYTSSTLTQGSENTSFAKSGVSVAGGSAQYQFTFENTGNLNYAATELVNILPHINDTLTTSTTARDSAFDMKLSSVEVLRNGVKDDSLVLERLQ